MNITELYFSPTGGTQKAADLFTQALAGQVQTVDLCDSRADFSAVSLSAEDLAVIAVRPMADGFLRWLSSACPPSTATAQPPF